MTELNQLYTIACTSYTCDSEEELFELFTSARNVAKPPGLTNEDVYISENNVLESNLIYSTVEPEQPTDPRGHTTIIANVTSNLTFHVHSYIEQERVGELITTHQQMMTKAGRIEVGYIATGFEVDAELEQVLEGNDFVQIENETQVESLNFIDDGLDINISNYPTETSLTVINPEIDPIEASFLGECVSESTERTKRYLGGMI